MARARGHRFESWKCIEKYSKSSSSEPLVFCQHRYNNFNILDLLATQVSDLGALWPSCFYLHVAATDVDDYEGWSGRVVVLPVSGFTKLNNSVDKEFAVAAVVWNFLVSCHWSLFFLPLSRRWLSIE